MPVFGIAEVETVVSDIVLIIIITTTASWNFGRL
jgi:hypothetical protein